MVPADLFKSVESPGPPPFPFLQGVWIHSSIKEDEGLLRTYFRSRLDARRIHFVVISDWQNDALVLARDREVQEYIEGTFDLSPSGRFTSREYAGPA